MTQSRRPSGFTLIELLIVLSVIALLLTIVYPRYFHSIDQSKEAVLRQDLHTLRDAIDKYRGDTGKYPESLDSLVAAKYLRAIPVDPITESAATWAITYSDNTDDPGVQDVSSGATGTGANGKPYREW